MSQVEAGQQGTAQSDAELIAAVRAGSSTAFGELYARHSAAALSVARQYVPRPADADDVVSDAFAKVYTILQGGGGPDVAFRAYLFTVVRRLSYDASKGARRTTPTDDLSAFEDAFGPMASTEEPTLAGFERSTVARAFEGLPERWRSVLWYSEIENMTPAQIAPMLGLTANGVAALAYRAREGLRQAYLQQHLAAPSPGDCEPTNGLLGSYVRGGLAKRETAKVEAHLDGCGDCRAIVLELGDVSHGMRAVVAPLVLGLGALGLVGSALPVGGAIAGAVAAGATTGTGAGAAGTGAAGTGAAGTGAAGTGAVGTGAAAGTGAVGAGAVGSGAVGTASSVAGLAGVGASAAGGAAVAGATGIAALIAAAPAAAIAIAVGAAAVVGVGIVAATKALTSQDPPPAVAGPSTGPSTGATDGASGGPSTAPSGAATTAPSDAPSSDPTSPTNIPADVLGVDAPLASAPPVDAGAVAIPGTGATSAPVVPGPVTTPDPGATSAPVVPDPVTTPDPVAVANVVVDAPTSVDLRARQDTTVLAAASNTGTATADDVSIDVVVPAGVELHGSTVGVFAAPAVLTMDALRCDAPRAPVDPALPADAQVVTCSLGDLAPGERKSASLTVWAKSGGSYRFGAAAWRAGQQRPPIKWSDATQVPNYGGELTTTLSGPSSMLNPAAAPFTLSVRNTGDETVKNVAAAVSVPDGMRLMASDGSWDCSPTGSGQATCVASADLSVGDVAKGRFSLQTSDASRAEGRATVKAVARASGVKASPDTDSDSATTAVGSSWAGAADGVGKVSVKCTAGTATIGVGYTNSAEFAVDAMAVAGGSSGSSTGLEPSSGDVTLKVGDGLRVPAGEAAVRLTTTVVDPVGGKWTPFSTTIDAGAFPATDCFTPSWEVETTASTSVVDGEVSLTVGLTNSTGQRVTGAVTTPFGSREVAADAGASISVVIPSGTNLVSAGTATFALSQDVPDNDGDPGRYRAPDGIAAAYTGLYAPDWSVDAAVAPVCVDGKVVLRGTLTNQSAEKMSTRMLASLPGYTESDAVSPLAAGATGSYSIPTGATKLAAGRVDFRLYRWFDVLGGYVHLEPAKYAASDCTPKPAASITVGDGAYDPDTALYTRPATITLDNSASAVPVTFTVTGSPLGKPVVTTVDSGARTELEPIAVPRGAAAFRVTAENLDKSLAVEATTVACAPRWQVGKAGTYQRGDLISALRHNYVVSERRTTVLGLTYAVWERDDEACVGTNNPRDPLFGLGAVGAVAEDTGTNAGPGSSSATQGSAKDGAADDSSKASGTPTSGATPSPSSTAKGKSSTSSTSPSTSTRSATTAPSAKQTPKTTPTPAPSAKRSATPTPTATPTPAPTRSAGRGSAPGQTAPSHSNDDDGSRTTGSAVGASGWRSLFSWLS